MDAFTVSWEGEHRWFLSAAPRRLAKGVAQMRACGGSGACGTIIAQELGRKCLGRAAVTAVVSRPSRRGGAARARAPAQGGAAAPAKANQRRGPGLAAHRCRVHGGEARSPGPLMVGLAAVPAKPAEFHRFPAPRADADAGRSQAKMRVCVDAASRPARGGQPPPP